MRRQSRRHDLPQAINGAIDWSGSPIQTADGLLRLINGQPRLRDRLIRATNASSATVKGVGGRPRLPGHWSLAYLCFVVDREPALRRWHAETGSKLWRRCGFTQKPNYDTTHHHFALLEEHSDAFRVAASELIQRAVKNSDGLVGRDVHIDGTEAETNARLYHDCQPDDPCRRRSARSDGVSHSPAAKAPTTAAREQRQDLAAEVPGTEPQYAATETTKRGRVRLSNGCYYRTSDPTAGVRVYRGRNRTLRFWHGFNNLKAVDHYTGAVIATETISASVNEADAYPILLNKILENSGQTPRAIAGDRGFSLASVFELNTKVGIASVFPWRKHKPGEQREQIACDAHDEHGVPRCRKCGAATDFESFQAGEKPRLWYSCQAGCGRGSIVCSKGWRHLLPLWRTEEAYLALRKSHSSYERAHWRWREQWLVGPDNPNSRPRRRGLPCHELRAQAAMLVEWLLVCYQQGWLGAPKRNQNAPYKTRAKAAFRRLARARANRGLHLPRSLRLAHQAQIAAIGESSRAGPNTS